VIFVDKVEDAHVRAEPNADEVLSQWVYVLAAPFPAPEDAVSLEALRTHWQGEEAGAPQIYLTLETGSVLESLLGDDPGSGVHWVQDYQLINSAWENRPALAIIPFEALEPRWKVLQVENASPIRKSFTLSGYPLTVQFGLSGEPAAVAELAEVLEWPATNRDPARMTILVMTGVTALTRTTAWKMETLGIDYPAQKIAAWLEEADVTHISNEVPFVSRCPEPTPLRETMEFCSHPRYVELLESIGVDLVELTGNHLIDYGVEGLSETLQIYEERGLLTFGGGADLEAALAPVIIEHHGNRLAFMGCNRAGPPGVWAKEALPGAAPCLEDHIFPQLRQLREAGTLPIFTYQWFEVPQTTPTTKQIQDFRAVAEAGAVIVSGSQAHQPQTFEFYEGSFLHYGLGNLFFDQMWMPARREFIDRHVFYEGRHISTELLTAVLEDYAQPRPMTVEERKAFLEAMFAASGW
jgi:poly-gamma-glutamate synthesis protein (capsule biosynthesis protein)